MSYNPSPGGGGGISTVVTQTGASYTAAADDDVILCNSAAITITLPTAVGDTGKTYYIKNIHATGIVTIDPNGAETIDGNAKTFVLTQNSNITFCSDNVGWRIL